MDQAGGNGGGDLPSVDSQGAQSQEETVLPVEAAEEQTPETGDASQPAEGEKAGAEDAGQSSETQISETVDASQPAEEQTPEAADASESATVEGEMGSQDGQDVNALPPQAINPAMARSAPMLMARAAAAPDPNNIYTSNTGKMKESTGNGTRENPYNLFKDALANVEDGGTIHVLNTDSTFIDAVEAPNVDDPFIIDKNVTVRGANGSKGVLQVRAAGIALGANVTFENIQLEFITSLRTWAAV